MNLTSGAAVRTGNRLLDMLPDDEFSRVARALDRVVLAHAESLIEPHVPLSHVYFPQTSLASLVTLLADGSTVESGAVGREGMVGVPVVLGADTTPMQTVAQVAGVAYRIDVRTFREILAESPTLQKILNRYVHTLFVVASQSTACNRKHVVEARLARWLLMSSDGVGSDAVAITQEFLSVMLGVRRAGVSEAAAQLQSEGLIRYSRGHVEIVNRSGLEQASCECYGIVRDEYARLFGVAPEAIRR